jgi:hypothetical protein
MRSLCNTPYKNAATAQPVGGGVARLGNVIVVVTCEGGVADACQVAFAHSQRLELMSAENTAAKNLIVIARLRYAISVVFG